MENQSHLHGLIAEFAEATDLKTAAALAWDAGYAQMDAFSPFPVEGLAPVEETRQFFEALPEVKEICEVAP